MHTGDLAIIDGQGYCSIVGRIKDMVRRCNYHSRCCVYSALALQWAALQPWPHGTHPNRSLLLRSPASLASPHGCCCSFTLCALPRSSVAERMCTLERWRSSFTGTRQWQKCRQGRQGEAEREGNLVWNTCSDRLRQRCANHWRTTSACLHDCRTPGPLWQLRPYLPVTVSEMGVLLFPLCSTCRCLVCRMPSGARSCVRGCASGAHTSCWGEPDGQVGTICGMYHHHTPTDASLRAADACMASAVCSCAAAAAAAHPGCKELLICACTPPCILPCENIVSILLAFPFFLCPGRAPVGPSVQRSCGCGAGGG